jgi:hypothetical protein
MAINKNSNVYFVFSKEQMDFKKEFAKKRGKIITFGTVIVRGVPKTYTDIVTSIDNLRYPDATVVASGILGNFKYTKEVK